MGFDDRPSARTARHTTLGREGRERLGHVRLGDRAQLGAAQRVGQRLERLGRMPRTRVAWRGRVGVRRAEGGPAAARATLRVEIGVRWAVALGVPRSGRACRARWERRCGYGRVAGSARGGVGR